MNCEHLEQLIKNPQNLVVDVRTQYEFQQGHIKGAKSIPLHELPNKVDFLKDKNVYLYCRSGARSEQGTIWLKTQGIKAENLGGLSNFIQCLQYT